MNTTTVVGPRLAVPGDARAPPRLAPPRLAPLQFVGDARRVACRITGAWYDDAFIDASRDTRSVRARWATAVVLRKHTDLSYPEIAQQVGFRSHTSVVDAYQRGRRRSDIAEAIDEMEKQLGLRPVPKPSWLIG